jgi:hypothetical protein
MGGHISRKIELNDEQHAKKREKAPPVIRDEHETGMAFNPTRPSLSLKKSALDRRLSNVARCCSFIL